MILLLSFPGTCLLYLFIVCSIKFYFVVCMCAGFLCFLLSPTFLWVLSSCVVGMKCESELECWVSLYKVSVWLLVVGFFFEEFCQFCHFLVFVCHFHEKLVDASRDFRIGVTAGTLTDLIERAKIKLEIPSSNSVRVVLEQDGTEIDDNDYFNTLDPDTSLMVLRHHEMWTPYKSILSWVFSFVYIHSSTSYILIYFEEQAKHFLYGNLNILNPSVEFSACLQ